ncbi:hypothetical protein D3C77_365920 [compost metagenome]
MCRNFTATHASRPDHAAQVKFGDVFELHLQRRQAGDIQFLEFKPVAFRAPSPLPGPFQPGSRQAPGRAAGHRPLPVVELELQLAVLCLQPLDDLGQVAATLAQLSDQAGDLVPVQLRVQYAKASVGFRPQGTGGTTQGITAAPICQAQRCAVPGFTRLLAEQTRGPGAIFDRQLPQPRAQRLSIKNIHPQCLALGVR